MEDDRNGSAASQPLPQAPVSLTRSRETPLSPVQEPASLEMMTPPSSTVAGKSFRPSGRVLAVLIGLAALSAEAVLVLGPARQKPVSVDERPPQTGGSTLLPTKLLPETTVTARTGGPTAQRRSSRSIQLVRQDSDPARRIRVPRRTPRPSPAGIW